MEKKIKISLLIVMLVFPLFGIAQQLPQFTQYMFNTISINPAYAGTRERLNITFLNRNQWVGIDGAPVTQTLSADLAIPKSKVGVGLSLIHDKLGYENTTYLFTDASYSINLKFDYVFTFGVKAGISKYGLDSELLMDSDAVGDQYLDRVFNNWKPNFGFGLYLRNDDWFVGLSTPRIIDYKNNTDIEYASIERASYYLNGGYMLEFTPQLAFKPTVLVKYTNGAPISLDVTANFLFNEKLWLGAAYRLNDAMGGYVSLKATDNLMFGYAYEFNTSDLRPYTSGSHEMFISFEFDFPEPRCDCENKF